MAGDDDLKEQLSQFQDAIRAKDNWVTKILDEKRGLATKWAVEAGLLVKDQPVLDDDENMGDEDPVDKDDEARVDEDVVDEDIIASALSELKAEATRIRVIDSLVRFDASGNVPRAIDFGSLDADIRNSLKYARGAKHAIQAPFPPLRQKAGVYVSDDIVPASLHHELVTELDALAQKEPKDLHPGTYGKVQDLIHPSLYPLVIGTTSINPSSSMPPVRDGEFVTSMETLRTKKFKSKYAWIPSIFSVSDDGKDVHIESYINGLGPRDRYSNLYRVIEKVFLFALPHFEKTLAFEFENEKTASELRWLDRAEARGTEDEQGVTHSEWQTILDRQLIEKGEQVSKQKEDDARMIAEAREERLNKARLFNLDDSIIASDTFKGKQLKVIVKAATYHLKPGQRYEGSWHIEGMPHERITASAIYYYDTDEAIIDAGLSLRRLRDPDTDFPDTEEYRHEAFNIHFADDEDGEPIDSEEPPEEYEDDYPSDWEQESYNGVLQPMSTSSLNAYITLGTVPTTNFKPADQAGESRGTGRILSFPNWIQHKVGELKNPKTSSKQAAQRKILCFFLVQDDIIDEAYVSYPGFSYNGLQGLKVLTTMDVPTQERGTNFRTLHFLLPVICKRLVNKTFPPELVDYVIGAVDQGVTREMAEKHRRELMKDRTVTDPNFDYHTWSLCEH